jgi:long-chain acyl-CoA synthetase
VNSRTVYQALEQAARKHQDAPALIQPETAGSVRRTYTYSWNQYLRAVEEIAAGLHALGVKRGDTVALCSETRLEFYLADLGVMTVGGLAAAMYPSYPPCDLVRTIAHVGAKVAIVENARMLEALRAAPVERWIVMKGTAEGAMALDDLRETGRRAMAADPLLLPGILSAQSPADLAILYLTSGATGDPKMVLVTHAALTSNIAMAPPVLELGPRDITVAFLPSAHIAQRVAVELLPIEYGMPVYFAESLMKLPQEIRAVRPTLLIAPPRMWERIYSTICAELRKRPAIARRAFYAGLALALAAQRYRDAGKAVPKRIAVPLRLADRLLFQKVRARFGGRLRVAASGAAPLSKSLAEFYAAIGLPIVEAYGLTEGGVVTINPVDRPKPGSIGKALPGVELRIAEDGELLIRAPCLSSGYLNDPEATAAVLRDGWLYTGDLASIDAEGFVYITGRKKELIVSSTGKKVFPARVESLFKMEPLVSHVLLIGDRLPYLTALFTINPQVAETLKGMHEFKGRPAAEMSQAPPVQAEIRRAVARVNKQLACFEQVRKWRVLERDFSIEAGELTATMKIRRGPVMANFREDIAALYEGREEL